MRARAPCALLLIASATAFASVLHDAVEKNNVTLLRERIQTLRNQKDLEAVDENELTPLHLAAYHGHVETAQALLEADAPIDTVCDAHGGMTALHWATGQGHIDVVRLLLTKGAALAMRDAGGRTPIHYAASRGLSDVLKALLEHRPPSRELLDATSALGVTALQMASEKGFTPAVELLLDAGALADSGPKDEHRISALHAAAAMGHEGVVHALLKAGASCDARDARARTPLHLSAAMGNSEAVVRALVAAGASLEARDADGRTPRRLAERQGHGPTVAALKAAGAEPGRLPLRLIARLVRWVRAAVKVGSAPA